MSECPVCYDDLSAQISVTIPCSHRVCFKCFLYLHKKECPMCRFHFEHVIPPLNQTEKRTLIEFIRDDLPTADLPTADLRTADAPR